MRQIMSGEVSPTLIAAITIGLRVKKETIGEIAAAAQVMREFATKVEVADQRASARHLRHRRRQRAHLQHLHRGSFVSRPRPAPRSPSTAAVRFPASRAAPTCWRRSA